MGFKRIAIAGASSIGTEGGWSWGTGAAIIHALVELKRADPKVWDEVIVVTRQVSFEKSSAEFAPLASVGLQVRSADYESVDSLVESIKGAEVVVSCIAGPNAIPTLARNLLHAVKRTPTVRRYLPSEFSFDLTAERNRESLGDYHLRKVAHRKEVEESGVEWAYIVTGSYLRPPTYLASLATATPSPTKVIRLSPSTKPPSTLVSGITVPDVGCLVAQLLVDSDETWWRNRSVKFLADEWGGKEAVDIVEKVTGKKVQVEWVDEKDANYFDLQGAKGLYWVPKSEWDTGRYPSVKVKTFQQVVEEEWSKVTGSAL
ncbi:hypothetical protein HDU93_002123 [Gonapodya sp. JEL0774]|nr:hypothetical protein HDU93_002123 [Gonapodya sp. JEL0774]